jgi:hypothetical protein
LRAIGVLKFINQDHPMRRLLCISQSAGNQRSLINQMIGVVESLSL